MSRFPASLTRGITIDYPGIAEQEGSDDDATACRNALSFGLGSLDWDYDVYTWHTNRDTFDKLSFDDLKSAATLIALLAYEAADDPQQLSTARRIPPSDSPPPNCFPVLRSWAASQQR